MTDGPTMSRANSPGGPVSAHYQGKGGERLGSMRILDNLDRQIANAARSSARPRGRIALGNLLTEPRLDGHGWLAGRP